MNAGFSQSRETEYVLAIADIDGEGLVGSGYDPEGTIIGLFQWLPVCICRCGTSARNLLYKRVYRGRS